MTTHLQIDDSGLRRGFRRIARKKHSCTCCNCDVLPGYGYWYLNWINEGLWSRARLCALCWPWYEALPDEYWYEPTAIGDLVARWSEFGQDHGYVRPREKK